MLLFLNEPAVTGFGLLLIVGFMLAVFSFFIWYGNRPKWPAMQNEVVAPTSKPTSAWCWIRQKMRRGTWFLLFPAIVIGYKWFYEALIYFQTLGLRGDDLDRAVADIGGKMVDPEQFYSKSFVALSNFCQINALGWGSLIVVPVLIDWAIGFYKEEQGEYPSVRGFKGTFLLKLTDWQRMIIFVVVWALELMIAAHSVDSAFRMQ